MTEPGRQQAETVWGALRQWLVDPQAVGADRAIARLSRELDAALRAVSPAGGRSSLSDEQTDAPHAGRPDSEPPQ